MAGHTATVKIVNSVEEVMHLVNEHELTHTLKFVKWYERKGFGETGNYLV